MSLKRIGFLVVFSALAAVTTMAGEPDAMDDPRTAMAQALNKRGLSDITPENLSPSPIAGVWELAVDMELYYVSEDGRYLVKGEIIDLNGFVNVTEHRKSSGRLAALREIDESRMIIFSPAEEPNVRLTVFTDIDCTYCQKLHQEIDVLNELGVEIRYLFYPRSGPGSLSWMKADAVWCSDDRQEALTEAKKQARAHARSGKAVMPPVALEDCTDSPVREHYEIATQLARGTPAIVTESGQLISGYMPAAQLVEYARTLNAQMAAKD